MPAVMASEVSWRMSHLATHHTQRPQAHLLHLIVPLLGRKRGTPCKSGGLTEVRGAKPTRDARAMATTSPPAHKRLRGSGPTLPW